MNPTNIDDVNGGSMQESRQDRRRRARQEGIGERRRLELGKWREVGRNLTAQIDEQVHKRPYVAIGAATGLGFVAGSLFGSRFGQVLMAVGLGYIAKGVLGDAASLDTLQAGIERMTGESAAAD
jgi:ElaB/YqjD/DUF883 family membrane-anchored ribosome-binding protein